MAVLFGAIESDVQVRPTACKADSYLLANRRAFSALIHVKALRSGVQFPALIYPAGDTSA